VISIQTPSGKSPEIKLPEVKLPQIKLPVITLPKLGIDFSKGGTITGTALPNEKVEVSVNGKSVGTTTADANGNWKFELPKLDVGLPVISVNTPSGKSIDVKLPEIKAPEVILPKIVLPSVNLPDFAAGATITGTAKPGERVQILLDGRVLGSAVADDKGNWSYQLPKLILGERVLGTRSASGVGPDVKISVLDKTLPVITVPTGGIVIDVTNGGRVRGTAGPNAKVDVLVDGKTVGTTTADARGNWTSAVPAQKAGDYVITAKSAAGTSDNVQVNVSEQTKILLPVTGGN
jgi:predicted secreted protein